MRLSSIVALACSVTACGAASGVLEGTLVEGDAGSPARTDATAMHPERDASAHDVYVAPFDAGHDARLVIDSSRESGRRDAPGASDAPVDSPLTENPDEIVMGHGLVLYGATEHGQIIYGDAKQSVFAIPFGGGVPQPILSQLAVADAGVTSLSVAIFHDVVFIAPPPSVGQSYTTPLYAWSGGAGTAVLLPNPRNQLGYPLAGASADSQYIAYGWSDDFGIQEYLANADGTGELLLHYGGVGFSGSYAVDFLGGCAGCQLFFGSYNSADGWAETELPTSQPIAAVDDIGHNALVVQGAGLVLQPLDGGPSTLVDPAPSLWLGSILYLSPASDLAVYSNGNGVGPSVIKAAEAPGGSPYTVATLPAARPYLAAVALASPFGPLAAVDEGSNIAILGLAPDASAPNVVLSGVPFGGFTADGSFVMLFGSTPQSTITFGAQSLTPGSAPTVLSTSSLQIASALTGTEVLFCDNFVADPATGLGPTDLCVADVATSAAPTTVASAVTDPDQGTLYALSPDLTQVAYVRNTGASNDGLYVTTIPPVP